jgi:hypothetical protein
MDDTPNLVLPYIMAAQAQKHVTHNEAIRALDALVQLAVLDRDLSAPPVSPADGARYIIAASPTGAWAGEAGSIAAWQDGAWRFYAPREGWLAWVADEGALLYFDGADWAAATSFGDPPMLGINATADTTNRLAVASDASLFSHDGAGHQMKINKAAAGDTASQLFQTGFSGRAEFGLTGDDDWHVKVSPDGTTWHEALIADRATGRVTFPNTPIWRQIAHSAVAASHTGNTTETVLATISIPAGSMGPNGMLRVTTLWSMTNTANNKTFRVRLGGASGTQFLNQAIAQASYQDHRLIRNRNSQSSQICSPAGGMVGGFGVTTGTLASGAVDTSAAQDLVLSAQLANSGETVTLESYTVEVCYGA